MNDVIRELCDTALFKGITANEIEKMQGCLSITQKSYKKHDYIITAGDPISKLGIILSGSANIIKEDFWGNSSLISKLTPRQTFCEEQCCAAVLQASFCIIACENTSVAFLDYYKFAHHCKTPCGCHTLLIKNMLDILAQKTISLNDKIEFTNKRSTREKLMSYLSDCAKKSNGNSFSIPFNRQELADYLNVDRSAMSSQLSKMQREGILKFNKNKFTLF